MQWRVLAVEAARAYAHEWFNHRAALSEKIRAVFEQGWSTPDEDYVAALAFGERCRAEFASIIEAHDLLLTPSAGGEAPRGLDWTGDVRFQTMWSFLRVPSSRCRPTRVPTSCRSGTSSSGRPTATGRCSTTRAGSNRC